MGHVCNIIHTYHIATICLVVLAYNTYNPQNAYFRALVIRHHANHQVQHTVNRDCKRTKASASEDRSSRDMFLRQPFFHLGVAGANNDPRNLEGSNTNT